MAITRRQFVTRMGTLAAAMGLSQGEVSKLVGAFAGNSSPVLGGAKPVVVWVHGAECTGCSTSLLGIFEDASGEIYGTEGVAQALGLSTSRVTTGDAVGLAGVTNALGGTFPTLDDVTLGAGARSLLYNEYGAGTEHVNIADVVVDVIDLQYHETVMTMGGDQAYQWLADFRAGSAAGTAGTFVLVVEGAVQERTEGGAWGETHSDVPWCSVGMGADFDPDTNPTAENDFAETVADLSVGAAAIIPIGQCACYGGYPGCKAQMGSDLAGFNTALSQTGAKGTHQFLSEFTHTNATFQADVRAAAAKVVAVPGCPTNPWWFVQTVVMIMVDLVNSGRPLGVLTAGGAPNPAAVDHGRRLKAVYPIPVHSAYCPRYPFYNNGVYAAKPGDPGCLQKLGCKGIGTNSQCGVHGWNNQQPQNSGTLGAITSHAGRGGHCTTAGHPCMGCTEKGYPDSFVPFVKL